MCLLRDKQQRTTRACHRMRGNSRSPCLTRLLSLQLSVCSAIARAAAIDSRASASHPAADHCSTTGNHPVLEHSGLPSSPSVTMSRIKHILFGDYDYSYLCSESPSNKRHTCKTSIARICAAADKTLCICTARVGQQHPDILASCNAHAQQQAYPGHACAWHDMSCKHTTTHTFPIDAAPFVTDNCSPPPMCQHPNGHTAASRSAPRPCFLAAMPTWDC